MIPKRDDNGEPIKDEAGEIVTEQCPYRQRNAGGLCQNCVGGKEAIKASKLCTVCRLVECVRSGLKCQNCKETKCFDGEGAKTRGKYVKRKESPATAKDVKRKRMRKAPTKTKRKKKAPTKTKRKAKH